MRIRKKRYRWEYLTVSAWNIKTNMYGSRKLGRSKLPLDDLIWSAYTLIHTSHVYLSIFKQNPRNPRPNFFFIIPQTCHRSDEPHDRNHRVVTPSSTPCYWLRKPQSSACARRNYSTKFRALISRNMKYRAGDADWILERAVYWTHGFSLFLTGYRVSWWMQPERESTTGIFLRKRTSKSARAARVNGFLLQARI